MHDSIRLGRVAGIPIGLHWSLLAFAALLIFNLTGSILPAVDPGFSTAAYFIASLVGVAGLFGSIALHELGHAVVARRNRVGVDGITLWLLGGVARLTGDPHAPGAAFRIAAAGPAVSVGLGVFGLASAAAVAALGAPSLLATVFVYLGVINLVLALFNLVPALPLDGGRILQAYLWHRRGDSHRATISAGEVGRVVGWLMIAVGLFGAITGTGPGLWTALIGWFVASGAKAEQRRARHELAEAERRERLANGGDGFSFVDLLNARFANGPVGDGPVGNADVRGWSRPSSAKSSAHTTSPTAANGTIIDIEPVDE